MLNHIVLMGRLTDTPELKHTESGKSVCSFSLAVDRDYKSNEEKVTDFIRCVAWRTTAEFICKYFSKGALIAVEGALQVRNYTDNNNQKRSISEVVISKVSFTGEKKQNNAEVTYSNNSGSNSNNAGNSDFMDIANDDDLPF